MLKKWLVDATSLLVSYISVTVVVKHLFKHRDKTWIRQQQWTDFLLFETYCSTTNLMPTYVVAVTFWRKTKDNQVIELRGTRYLFGRLLYISSEKKVDLLKVFCYPLIPIPLSIGHIDGTLNKTDKSTLMKQVENMCVWPLPPSVPDVVLVDATFMLHTLHGLPRTMGDVSTMILTLLCKMGKVVHFVCDVYSTPSIKDMERAKRGEDGRT